MPIEGKSSVDTSSEAVMSSAFHERDASDEGTRSKGVRDRRVSAIRVDDTLTAYETSAAAESDLLPCPHAHRASTSTSRFDARIATHVGSFVSSLATRARQGLLQLHSHLAADGPVITDTHTVPSATTAVRNDTDTAHMTRNQCNTATSGMQCFLFQN